MTSHEEATGGEIVVGIDETASSLAALRWAAAYSERTGARMRLVHAFQLEPSEMYGVGTDLRHTLAQEARTRISRLVDDALGADRRPGSQRIEIVEGPTAPTLLARADGAELLVIGTGDHSGLRRVLPGSVSHYCISHAHQPVISVPPTASPQLPLTASAPSEDLAIGQPSR